MKRLLALWLVGFLLAAQPSPAVVCVGFGTSVCSITPLTSQDTHNAGTNIGDTDSARYAGILNVSVDALNICSVDVYIRENGNLAGEILYVELWSVEAGSGRMLISKLEDIKAIDATLAPTTIGYLSINFGKVVSVGTNQALVFTMRKTTGTTNYLTVALTTTDVISGQQFRRWSSTLFEISGVSTNDMRLKTYGQN